MLQLLSEQEELADWNINFWVNTVKKSKENITIGFLTHRLQELEEYWETFFERHRNIMMMPGVAQLDYTTKAAEAYFDVAGQIAEEIWIRSVASVSKDVTSAFLRLYLVQFLGCNVCT